jgi:hypothetical protein
VKYLSVDIELAVCGSINQSSGINLGSAAHDISVVLLVK